MKSVCKVVATINILTLQLIYLWGCELSGSSSCSLPTPNTYKRLSCSGSPTIPIVTVWASHMNTKDCDAQV